jgi:hypothetical protein
LQKDLEEKEKIFVRLIEEGKEEKVLCLPSAPSSPSCSCFSLCPPSALSSCTSCVGTLLLVSFSAVLLKYSQQVVFTCGHHFPYLDFHGKILPEFHERVSKFSESIFISLFFFYKEYKQNAINLACPYCLYAYLQKLQPEKTPNWEY